MFGTWKVRRLDQSRSKGEIPGRARRKERLSRSKLKQAFLIDSDAELFMYLIQCIRFGSWKVRRLNQALISIQLQKNLPTFDESGAPNNGFLLKFVSVRSS